eukprot:731158-Prorocentrum_minimum.AAC.1
MGVHPPFKSAAYEGRSWVPGPLIRGGLCIPLPGSGRGGSVRLAGGAALGPKCPPPTRRDLTGPAWHAPARTAPHQRRPRRQRRNHSIHLHEAAVGVISREHV